MIAVFQNIEMELLNDSIDNGLCSEWINNIIGFPLICSNKYIDTKWEGEIKRKTFSKITGTNIHKRQRQNYDRFTVLIHSYNA